MDRSALARRHRQDAAQAAKSTTQIARDKRTQQEKLRSGAHGKIRLAKDSNEITRLTRTTVLVDRPRTGDSGNSRLFTVANVGTGGTLYLKPCRMVPPAFTHAPVTPPDTPYGEQFHTQWLSDRQSGASGGWTPRPRASAHGTHEEPIPLPPMDLPSLLPPLSSKHASPKRQTRSRSFSTVSDRVRSLTGEASDVQFMINGTPAGPRPRSSMNISGGLLDLHIPSYGLGVPKFTDHGTAYLHDSTHTSTTDDIDSSVFSRADYDKLFPAPPGQTRRGSPSSTSPYPHHSSARVSPTPSNALLTSPAITSFSHHGGITATIFNGIEAHLDDPSLVRYHSTTRKIVAATPARLIAQITSPILLDYELLSDFFLTYRCFMTPRDLMEYLLARMEWALGTATDVGRIVRVRTFVALRHWILNYFADDFALDAEFRERFCNLVNGLTRGLSQRPDHGGSDMNIMGELKKCWRRTCATFWPLADAFDTSPSTDILPGGDQEESLEASIASLPTPLRLLNPKADFRRVSVSLQVPVEQEVEESPMRDTTMQVSGVESSRSMQAASIPTSPMSEISLQVLSCSVPCLRRMIPLGRDGMNRPAHMRRNPSLAGLQAKPAHQHKRSGSFSDALRNERPLLPPRQKDEADVGTLAAITFTGGLVRGLVLQPSPANVELLIPISPSVDPRGGHFDGIEESYFVADRSQQNLAVKRLVGDMRRALSSRKGRHGSPTSCHHGMPGSSDGHGLAQCMLCQPSAWQQRRGPPRIDVLGVKIDVSYREAFRAADLPNPIDEAARRESSIASSESDVIVEEQESPPRRLALARLNSHVTIGDRSILIMDDTGSWDPSLTPNAMHAASSPADNMLTPRSLFRNSDDARTSHPHQDFGSVEGSTRRPASFAGNTRDENRASGLPMHALLSNHGWRAEVLAHEDGSVLDDGQTQDKHTSGEYVMETNLSPARHQLRRRPGGDLKAADHVHDLETSPRPLSPDSFSTISRPLTFSGVQSTSVFGTHSYGPGEDSGPWQTPMTVPERNLNSVTLLETHSSQPNLRPSFQAEVLQLARLSDRSYIGGIEDALMKLEGKISSPVDSSFSRTKSAEPFRLRHQFNGYEPAIANTSIPAARPSSLDDGLLQSPVTETQGASIYCHSDSDFASDLGSPGAHHLSARTITSPDASDRSYVYTGAPPPTPETTGEDDDSIRPDNMPTSAATERSFLLDDNESLSDISTEIAEQLDDDSFGVRSFFFDDTADDDDVLPQHWPAPPTPPSTVGAAPERSPERGGGRAEVRPLKAAQSAPKLLSPNLDRQITLQHQPSMASAGPPRASTAPSSNFTGHLPFILAFESETVAEQLTIVEKDALDEVDWKDLIGMQWRQSSTSVRNWVDFLKDETCNGIDIVVARFNLVVKWVVSELLLTDSISERARCITKFIHIATHCRRFRNYASMYQITLGLLSADLAGLRRTWALVAPAEKEMLDTLEKLCQPLRNFHNLRAEMERSSVEVGCIPFIGLYTHDLTYNAQKPARVNPPTPSTADPLVNFERYQTAATIVKSLLRLIEASSKYVFHPHPEVLSRCLWLAALEDAEISARSKAIEL